MKPMLGVAVAAVGFGLWAGFNGWSSPPILKTVNAGLSALIGANLLFCSWLLWRAKPGSGDATVLPMLIVLSVAILLGNLPRLLWPESDALRMAGSIACLLIVTIVLVVEMRKRRRLRQRSGTA